MARDYARQRKEAPRHTHSKKSSGGLPGWLWALCGLTLGLGVAAIVFIVYRPVESPAVVQGPPSRPVATPTPGPVVPPRQESRFKFYDGLAKAQVNPNEEAYKVEPPPPAAEDTNRYVLQAGSFRTREDAERRKATVALLGFESSIKEVELEERGTVFRVQIGPDMTRAVAEKAMRQLADNDIDSFATRAGG